MHKLGLATHALVLARNRVTAAAPSSGAALNETLRELGRLVHRVASSRDWARERQRLAATSGLVQHEQKKAEIKARAHVSRLVARHDALVAQHSELVQLADAAGSGEEHAQLADLATELCGEAERLGWELLLQGGGGGGADGDGEGEGQGLDDNMARVCYVEVKAGAGGVESMDWVQMLARMYARWGSGNGPAGVAAAAAAAAAAAQTRQEAEIVDEVHGDEAGLKSATLRLKGDNVFAWLKGETGIHRLIRISPFDSNARRHTSFASVNVYPSHEDDEDGGADDDVDGIELSKGELRIDVYRASGAGGQHVNKTESAVRITHLPTGTVAQSQSERSQHQNKEHAMRLLKAKLREQVRRRRAEEQAKRMADRPAPAWGAQARTYTLEPYQLVKDHRTGVEHPSPSAVLDGDLDRFLIESLTQAAASRSSLRA